MVTVRLYSFSKKENSTAQPSVAPVEYSCILKDSTGIINPTITLDIGLSSSPSQYNYAYIVEFNRFYWIREWVNEHPLWNASMVVDVLASNKNAIGLSNLYVLRSSQVYDGNIIDGYYEHKTNSAISKYAITKPHNISPIGVTNGSYIVGLISGDTSSSLTAYLSLYGSIRYIQMDRKNLLKLVNYITDVNNWSGTGGLGFDLNDASLSLQKSLADPLQFITSCMWVPVDISASLTATDLDLYGWKIPNIEYLPLSSLSIINSASVNVNIPKHPSTNTRGNYVNVTPNTKLWLDVQPYGLIDLDTTITSNADVITLNESIDLIDGKGILSISINNNVVDKYNAQVGVNINLSQVAKDYMGMARGGLNAISGIFDVGVSSFTMNKALSKSKVNTGKVLGSAGGIVGGITQAIGGAMDAYEASFPKAKSLGGGGGFIDVEQDWYLISQFFIQTDDDNDHVGRPLYQNRVINTLSGFILVKDGSIDLPITIDELNMVRGYLESGFYYE